MDQNVLIEQIMSQLRGEVEQLVRGTQTQGDTLDQAEQRGRTFGQRCGKVALEGVLQASAAAQNHGHVGPEITNDDGTAHFERYESRWVLTHLGRVRIRRAYYWNRQAQRGVIPLDQQWDLDEREPSPALRRSIGMLSAEIPFARSARLMEQVALVDLPDKRLQESSEELGLRIKAQRDEAVAKMSLRRDDPRIAWPSVPADQRHGTLYVLMDGGRINLRDEGWKEPKIATLYWDTDRSEISKDRGAITKKEYIATLGDADRLAELLWETAVRWKFWRAERVVVLGDGAPWIWNRATALFPDATQILDRYHLNEHIWELGRLLFGGHGKHQSKPEPHDHVIELNPKDLKTRRWVKAMLDHLDAGHVDAVLAELEQQAPNSSETQKAVDALIGYLKDHRSRMRYDLYRQQGLCIVAGAIESGVKNVANQRMKGCGMRWALDRAESMLHLRAAYLSDTGPAHGLIAA